MTTNTKERSEKIQAAAQHLLIEKSVDVSKKIKILALAKILEERENCDRTTAKKHIAQAAHRMRHPDWSPPAWGGPRDGSGRPKAETSTK